MNKIFAVVLQLVLAVALHAVAWADGRQLIYKVIPNVNDTYADGTPTALGERYALVRLNQGVAGVEFAADGTLVDTSKGEIVRVRASSTKKRGYAFTYTIDTDTTDALIAKGGNLAVYLLDTRVYGTDGDVTLAAVSDGRVASVNASVLLPKSIYPVKSIDDDSQPSFTFDAASVTTVTAIPKDTPDPVITGIVRMDGKARIMVTNTVPCLQYNLAFGEQPDAVDPASRAARLPCNGVLDGVIELEATNETDRAFYKVNRN